jgi:proteasome assembly chaperone (PAC2) family protein
MPEKLTNPWLVAVWPGMGGVAVNAGAVLIKELRMRPAESLPTTDYFDQQHIAVEDGIASAPAAPMTVFYEWVNPRDGADLVVVMNEQQATRDQLEFCRKIIEAAKQRGVKRVVTFASLATQVHPSEEPRVFAVATDQDSLDLVTPHEVIPLPEGQIGGLNGLLLLAAAEAKLPGVCLLGEIPYFAPAVPHPKASRAVLQKFEAISGISVDQSELESQAAKVERHLISLMERIEESAESDEDEFIVDVEREESDSQEDLDYEAQQRIERLFEAAQQDRSKATRLKAELDRLGVFEKYEDRFLDLFRRGE